MMRGLIAPVLVGFVALAVPVSSFVAIPDAVYDAMPWMSFECTEDGPHAASFPDPLQPGAIVHVTLTCLGDLAPDAHVGTDCPSHEYGFWAGVVNGAVTYRYAQQTEDGLSLASIFAAWDNANNAWDAEVAADLFAGHDTGGQGKNVGRNDGVNQVGFKNLGGQTLAVQYAWVQGGVIVQSDSGYNKLATWDTNGAGNKYDLEGVAAQEFGHGYGLDHPADTPENECLTMYPFGNAGDTTKRTPGDGDILGIRARYP